MNTLLNYSQKKINVNQPCFRCQHLFIIMVFIIFGCKKNIKYKKNNLRDPIPTSARAIAKPAQNFQIKNFFLPKKINGAQLTATIKSLERFNIGEHAGITINMYQGGIQDFYQFFICNRKSLTCHPKAQTPGEFALSVHHYHLPPSGLVEVSVRACVRPERAINPGQLCGKYTTDSLSLGPSGNPEIKKILSDRNSKLDQAKKQCFEFFEKIKPFQEKLSSHPELSETIIARSLQKQLEVGKDTSCELIYSTLYEEISEHSEIADKMEANSTKGESSDKSGWTPKSIALLSLGGIAAIGGGVLVAKSAGFDFWKVKIKLTNTDSSPHYLEAKKFYDQLRQKIHKDDILTKETDKKVADLNLIKEVQNLYQKHAYQIEINRNALADSLKELRKEMSDVQ